MTKISDAKRMAKWEAIRYKIGKAKKNERERGERDRARSAIPAITEREKVDSYLFRKQCTGALKNILLVSNYR